ncbi:MAG: glycosyltransferase [Gemmatimonadota bacterium]
MTFLLPSLAGGGAERAVLDLLNTLNRGEFRLSLLVDRRSGTLLAELPPDVPVRDLSGALAWRRVLGGPVAIRRAVRRMGTDVLVSSLLRANTAVARSLLLPGPRPRVILVVQNNLSSLLERHGTAKRSYLDSHIRYLYPRADALVGVSSGVCDDLVERFGAPRSKTRRIPNGVDVARVRKSAGQAADLPWADADVPLFVAIGRMVPQKSHLDLVKAFALARAQRRMRLAILGDGPLRAAIEAAVREAEVEPDVYLPGFVSNPWSYLARSAGYVSASRWEGFSLALLEAMACGAPVLHTDCDFGPREIIRDGENGFLVPVGDTPALADRLVQLAGSQPLRNRLARAGRQDVGSYDMGRIGQRYEHLFHEVVTG